MSTTDIQGQQARGYIAINGSRLHLQVFLFALAAEILFVFLDATVNYDA